jgi:3-methylcrotonyl-CoA carboxylase alpha subunit
LREGEVQKDVEVTYAGDSPRVTIDGETHDVAGAGGAFARAGVAHVFLDGEHRVFEWMDPYLPEKSHADTHGGLRAPMPGRILAVHVAPGAAVKRGTPLVVMEAMKMEHTVVAPAGGVVERVLCAVGEQVKEGVELLEFHADGTRDS